ncbi:MAG: rod shape-determining protein MreD [Lachnospiraceae bacterium]|nr:rod shape-determining protein MreD [Lachnospiraceae bacterium]
MIFKVLLVLAEIVISYILQTSVFSHFRLADVVPDVMMILTVSMAFISGKRAGALSGFVCGFIIDCTYGPLIGLFALMYSTMGYLCGYSNRVYFQEDYTLPLFLVGGAEFVYNFIYYVFFYLLKGNLDLPHYMVRFMFPSVIYTVIVSIVIYRLLNFNHNLFTFIDDKREKNAKRTYEYKDFDMLRRH